MLGEEVEADIPLSVAGGAIRRGVSISRGKGRFSSRRATELDEIRCCELDDPVGRDACVAWMDFKR